MRDARRFADDPAGRAYYEKSARVLITTWGGEGCEITDYASRDLSGLIASYYRPRWETFFSLLEKSATDNTPLDMEAVNGEMAAFEWGWTEQQTEFGDTPRGDPLEIVKEVFEKYSTYFEICND